LGSDLSHWKEEDSSNFPTEDRKFYGLCVVGDSIYTHGGQDVYDNASGDTWIYHLRVSVVIVTLNVKRIRFGRKWQNNNIVRLPYTE
jgi:hypothetical protein